VKAIDSTTLKPPTIAAISGPFETPTGRCMMEFNPNAMPLSLANGMTLHDACLHNSLDCFVVHA
jgi:hypothetical protein